MKNNWRTCTLGDVAEVIGGFAFKSNDFSDNGNCLVFKIKDIQSPIIETKTATSIFLENYNEEKLLRYKIKKGDFVVAMTGATVGKVGVLKEEISGYINQRVGKINPKHGVDKKFVYYNISGKDFQIFIQNNIDSNSAQENISSSSIERYEIQLPPLPEQRAIGEVLSSLDDKIDLLHRQNKTLEAMAETLFRHHFIDNAQPNWEKKKLRDLVDCYNGVSYKGVDLNDSSYALITLKSFNRDGSFSLDGFKEYTGKYKEQHIAEEKDLIVAHTDITQDAAIIGNPVLVYKPNKYKKLLFTMDIVKVKSKFEWLSNEFLYFLMRTNEFKEHCLGYSNGSTVLHLSKKAIPEFEFCFPSQEIIKSHSSFLKDAISKILSNMKQIQTLEKLRDTLLPKLISGKITLKGMN